MSVNAAVVLREPVGEFRLAVSSFVRKAKKWL
jgi:hypothetical protein